MAAETALVANAHGTIFALASGLGKAAIAVFRISGPECSAALAALAPGVRFPARQSVLATIRHPETLEPIDRALITRFEAPLSFTGEDLAELGITGGRAVISALAEALSLVSGLRPAEAGEFARRAFVNGKIDLSEVEGIADLVDAETEAQRRQALRIAGGALRRESEAIRALLIGAMAAIESQIDFSDVEDAETLTLESIKQAARDTRDRIDHALASAAAARRLREGFVVVIAGPPNVGKSTLMNALAGREVAITSPFAGTTRDLIEVFLDLRGYPVMLVDTAGIRDSDDPIEREGVARALRRAESADLTLWLNDGDTAPPRFLEGQAVAVRTKIDRPGGRRMASCWSDLAVSAKTGEGIDKLLDAIGNLAEERMASSEPAVLTLERHRRAFEEARESLSSVLAPEASEPELIAEDLRRAATAMDRIAGRIGVEDILGEIFSRLCVGK
jgi:tRNA modification GTPase